MRRKNNCRGVMGNKGLISIVELIIAGIILFVTFSIFFPGFTYTSKWDRALLVSRARDSFITLDSMNNLSAYSFDQNATYDFLNQTFYDSNLIFWSQTENAIKSSITVACHCDITETEAVNSWTHDVMVNGRRVDLIIHNFTLSPNSPVIPSDVLLIFEEEDLGPYMPVLRNYLKDGNGIVEIRDFSVPPDIDAAQRELFGIENIGAGNGDQGILVKPGAVNELIYQPYKYFYNVPLVLNATAPVPKEECSKYNATGTMRMREQDYDFWICNSSRIYIDRDQDPNTAPSGPFLPTDRFILDGYEFEVEFVRGNITGISFRNQNGEYQFIEFFKDPVGSIKPAAANGEYDRALVYLKGNPVDPSCGVVVNNTENSRTAWMADFTRVGFENVGDDHRQILVTSLLWASNKKETDVPYSEIQIGYKSSFIDIIEKDLLEIYKLDIGLGFPY